MKDQCEDANSSDEEREILPPYFSQTISMDAVRIAFDKMMNKAASKMYNKYLVSRMPQFLTEWYLANFEGLAQVKNYMN